MRNEASLKEETHRGEEERERKKTSKSTKQSQGARIAIQGSRKWMRRFPALAITMTAAKQTVTKPDTGQDRYGNYNMLADIPSTSNKNPASHIDKTTKQNEEKDEESEPNTTTGKDQTMEREPNTLSIIFGNIHFL